MAKVVLAYSGGLDTSVAVRWLMDSYNLEVVTLTADLGGDVDLEAARQKALQVGAVEAYVVDAREQFVHDFVLPALQADALYEGAYPLATALARTRRRMPSSRADRACWGGGRPSGSARTAGAGSGSASPGT